MVDKSEKVTEHFAILRNTDDGSAIRSVIYRYSKKVCGVGG